jgi:hypothetical protein
MTAVVARAGVLLLSLLWLPPFLASGLPQTVSKSYVQIAFCDLVRRPGDYDGKSVSVHASYRYGFEWQELYCMDCLGAGRTWLELPAELSDDAKRAFRYAPKWQGTLNGTFRGVFQAKSGAFGDGGYKFRLVLESAANVKVISRSSYGPEALPQAERQRVCHGKSADR